MLYKVLLLLLAIVLSGVILTGCYKNVSIVKDADEITRVVSFSGDILPIFNESCNGSGCHNAGGKAPNLAPSSAYNVIKSGYINAGDPEKSELYLWMAGKRGTPMPLSGPNKQYNSLVLAWIKQGALNN